MLQERLRTALALPDDQGPVGTAVGILLADAAQAGVSDVHLNPTAAGLDVLYRRDGVLHPALTLPADVRERVVGRVKVLAGLLTYRRDIAQDGQIPAKDAGLTTDVRVAIFPTIHGEKAVLRFFLHGEQKFELDALGLEPAIAAGLRAAIAKPEGVILLTGPSGSGKTTTIYSLLAALRDKRHVVTIEDPVEHALSGVTQTQVNPNAGVTFGYSLRALLRQDPEVIMVGEIRDRETARVAMEAGLTGHLVISTVHAGTAAGVVTRLLEMGTEPHVLTASLSCVLAQRLVRARCAPCDAKGCDGCAGTGYRGRRVIAELLAADDAIRKAIATGADAPALQRLAVDRGLVPLRDAGDRLVRDGITTAAELLRVLG
jgi:type II secretory ATPase GspE/PulE/Tfp pilus assembly ATPase PilB-like protein